MSSTQIRSSQLRATLQGVVNKHSRVCFPGGSSSPRKPGSTGRSEHGHIVSPEQAGVAGSQDEVA